MIFEIKLRIAYEYANPAVGGRHVVCVMPLSVGAAQTVQKATLQIEPVPQERIDRLDFFGNQVTEFSFRGPHDSVILTLRARVARTAVVQSLAGAAGMPQLRAELADSCDVGPDAPLHFVSPSHRVPHDAAMTAFALAHAQPDLTVVQVVMAVGRALHRHMRFDPTATTVDTPAVEAFAKRRGVCQDFSHIMIACLRGIGIPAGYVSGFLRTLPPLGKPRLEGADAMHAWVRAWCGTAVGWIEFDPTNDCLTGGDHISVARGRDYSDVSPIKGIMRTAGRQQSHQAVDVIPVV